MHLKYLKYTFAMRFQRNISLLLGNGGSTRGVHRFRTCRSDEEGPDAEWGAWGMESGMVAAAAPHGGGIGRSSRKGLCDAPSRASGQALRLRGVGGGGSKEAKRRND
jgi:hypothetical protein